MAFPLALLLSLGAIAAGTAVKSNADSKAQEDQAFRTREEQDRQAAFDKEAQALAAQNREAFARPATQSGIGKEVERIKGAYAKSASIAPHLNDTPAGAKGGNRVVESAYAGKRADSAAKGLQENAALAQLQGLGNFLQTANSEAMPRSDMIGGIAGFKRSSASLLPGELQAAWAKRNGQRQLGDILVAIGSLYGGVAGAAAGAGSTAATANSNPGVQPTGNFSGNGGISFNGGGYQFQPQSGYFNSSTPPAGFSFGPS
jgi:hypothetical protein